MRQAGALDYGVIVFYLCFIVAVGLYFRQRVKGAHDYFAGGNKIPWWISAISFYMSSFSAWTFSGAAGFVYNKGFFAVIYFATWSLAMFIGYRFTAARWRRTRAISPVEYAATRFNVTTQQFVSWITTTQGILGAGITLTAVSKIIGSTLGLPVETVVVVAGVTMLLYTYLGGLWAVAVTDVLQFVVLLAITLVIMPLSLKAAGGLWAVIQAAPAIEWSFDYRGLHYNLHWLVGVTLINIVNAMSLSRAQRYYSVVDEKAALRVGRYASLLFITVPILFGLPPLAARLLWPDLQAVPFFAQIAQPSDVIYVGLALTILPSGLIGLFLVAMFAATMSSLDTSYNVASAIISRDIYKGVFKPDATDKQMFMVGKVATLLIGITVTALGLWYASSQLGIFNLMVVVVSLFNLPLAIPMAVGLLSRGVARWSAVAAIAWGLGINLLAQYVLKLPVGFLIYAGAGFSTIILFGSIWLGRWHRDRISLVRALAVAWAALLWVALPAIATVPLGTASVWVLRLSAIVFGLSIPFLAARFARETDAEERMVDAFFEKLATPINVAREVYSNGVPNSAGFGLIGVLTAVIGAAVWVLVAFPGGRDAWHLNLVLGALLVTAGGLMLVFGRRSERVFRAQMEEEVGRLSSEN